MIRVDRVLDIHDLKRQGHPIRAIAEITGPAVTPSARSSADSTPPVNRPNATKLDPFQDYLRRRRAEYPFSAVRLLDQIRMMGYAGPCRPSAASSPHSTVLVTTSGYAADALQMVRLTGGPTGGTFTLSFGGPTTAAIPFNASAATVQAALEALSSIGGGNVVVTAAPGGGWQVRFTGSRAGAYQSALTANGSGLTGGPSPGVTVGVLSAGGDAGQAVSTTDPLGRVARSYFDALGRTTETVENFTDGVVTGTSNKTTSYTYNGVGVTSLTAWLAGGGGQTTAYVYGVTKAGGSGIDSNDIVGATQWPDPTTGAASSSEQETTTVNALGETRTSTDRNGTTHTLTHDVLGRVASDAVTTLGAGVDGSVRRIDTAYDSQGNAYRVTSYDAVSGGTIVNQVENVYNGLGQLTVQYQAVGGAVNTSTTPKVQYTYSEMAGGANDSRLTSVVYPDGYTVHYNYATGLDDRIGRLTSLSDSAGTLESYLYLGLGTVVERGHPESTLVQTFISQTGSTGDAGDRYTGLDRFGRVVVQLWYTLATGVPSTAVTVFDVQYGYDANGNVLWRNDLVNSAFSELYTYDSLNQLATFARGTLNGTGTGISGTPSVSESWSYDALGNRTSVTTNGNSQSYSANAQNEYTSIGGATTPAYDANGNMTTDETGRRFVYDAWNRLVAVKNASGTMLETFSYDGLNRRMTSTVGGTTTDLYYSDSWQVLGEQSGGVYTTRYVWSPVYIDAMISRDTDTSGTGLNATGTSYLRLWPTEDANWDVTALVDGTGTVVERYTYDPFGTGTVYSPAYGIHADGSSYVWQYEFQGLRIDSVGEGLYARNREYDPNLGRFTSLDPSQYSSGDTSLYVFTRNNPIIYCDAFGLAAKAVTSKEWDELVKTKVQRPASEKRNDAQQMGVYFEDAVLRLYGIEKYTGSSYTSVARNEKRLASLGGAKGEGYQVVPDGIAPVWKINAGISSVSANGARLIPNGHFIDAKRGKSVLRASSYDWEAVGYADVLGGIARKAVMGPSRPMMTYVITTDLKINQDVIAEFSKPQNDVVLVTTHLMYDADKCEVSIGDLTVLNEKKVWQLQLSAPSGSKKLDWDLIKPFGDSNKSNNGNDD